MPEYLEGDRTAHIVDDLLPQFVWYFPIGKSLLEILARDDPILIMIEIPEGNDQLVFSPASLSGQHQPSRIIDLAVFTEVCIVHDSVCDVTDILILHKWAVQDKRLQDCFPTYSSRGIYQLVKNFCLIRPVFRAEFLC